MGQCAYKTFLRAGGPMTAEWAQRYFGAARADEQNLSETWGKDSNSQTVATNSAERSVFTSSFFMDLPFPKPEGLYIAVSDVPCLGSTRISRRPFGEMLSWCRPPGDVPNTIPRPNIEEQTLWPWTPEEEAASCGVKKAPQKSATAPPASPPSPPPEEPPPTRREMYGGT
ncbi:MAG TPA: hypothetical protein PKW35_13610, partial [Nannocystaceae bacterium]|nr:hypothetical protein [Nannocystaceae bacterium]